MRIVGIALSFALAVIAVTVACTGYDPASEDTSDGGASGEGGSQAANEGGPGAGDGSGDGPLGPVVDADHRPGSRLQPNFLTVGTERELVDWWDTKLRVHCTFRTLANGELRCLPVVPGGFVAPNLFATSACNSPAIKANAFSCASKPEILAVEEGDCSTTFYRTGASIPQHFYRDVSTGACIGQGEVLGAYERGAEVPLTEFVKGALEDGTVPTGTAVKAQFVRTEDGAYGFFRWMTASTASTACTFRSLGNDPTVRCYPTELAQGSPSFADANCASPLFYPSSTQCVSKPVIGVRLTSTGDRCSRTTTTDGFFLIGSDFTGIVHERNASNACVAGASQSGLLRGGAAIDPATVFAGTTLRRVPTQARLEAEYAVLPTGARSWIGWFDPVKATACKLALATDGQWRCIPVGGAGGSIVRAYDSSNCTTQKEIAYVGSTLALQCRSKPDGDQGGLCAEPPCALPPKPAFLSRIGGSDGCAVTPSRAYTFGDPVTAYARSGQGGPPACTAFSRSDESAFALLEVPPLELAPAVLSFP